VLPVGRWCFDRPLFDLTFPCVVRLAAVLVPRFVRVLRFPLIFFLPELRFVCRAISSSPRIRAPNRMFAATLADLQRADLSRRSTMKHFAVPVTRKCSSHSKHSVTATR
jgi:hypothetical protein